MRLITCSTGETAKTYPKYLKTRHWKQKRIEFFNSKYSTGHCVFCKNKKVQLHHKTYKNIGNEKLKDLVEVCRRHHKAIHENGLKLSKRKKRKKKKKNFDEKRIEEIEKMRRRNASMPYRVKVENGMAIKVYGVRYHKPMK